MDYNDYLKRNKFDKYLAQIKKKLQNKKILIYGAGQLFKYIIDNYNLSDLNIIGICDKSFTENQENDSIYGYKIISLNNINNYDYNCVLVSVLKYDTLGYFLRTTIKDKKVLFFPLIKQLLSERIKEIFSKKISIKSLLNNLLTYFAFTNKIIAYYVDKKNTKQYLNICKTTKKNYNKILKKLKKKAKNEKIRVGFLCFDSARWKAQSLYELLEKDEHFEPFIIMSKLYVGNGNQTRVQTNDDFLEKCKYFKKNHKVCYAYDLEKDKYLKLEEFNADYIFYQLPFYYHKNQMPLITSKNALTAYIPYYVSLIPNETKFDTLFRACLHKYYLPYNEQKEYYEKNMWNDGQNIYVSGHTALDDFYLGNNSEKNSNTTIIYSPHHSIENNSPLKLATFNELGEAMLKYAQKHPEINWIFRPHPLLKNVLKTILPDDKINDYYSAWEKIGLYDTDGDYIDRFLKSDLLINDSGFIIEYLPTGKPAIQLINPKRACYDKFTENAIDCCYKVETKEDLYKTLDKLIIEKNDDKKEIRSNFINQKKLGQIYAAENILNDIKKELNLI